MKTIGLLGNNCNMSETLDHYNRAAAQYAQVNHGPDRVSPDMEEFVQRLRAVGGPGRLRVLDAGSGSGRDTQAFLSRGFEVMAFDGSVALAEISTRSTGQPTRVMRFEAMDLPVDYFDGIWAMASLLHVARPDLPKVLLDLGASLKPGGLLYASFKYGKSDRVDPRDGRAFTDLNESAVAGLLDGMTGWHLLATTTTPAPVGQTNREPWFSFTLRRVGLAPAFKHPKPSPSRATPHR